MRRGSATAGLGLVVLGLMSPIANKAAAAPAKPNGLAQLNATFGAACNAQANDHSTSWAHGAWNGSGNPSTVLMHPLLGNEVNLARWAVAVGTGGDEKLTYGIGGYYCRKKTGSTTQWSTHAWGVAVDTNTVHNPGGQTYWNGTGWNGVDYGTAVPEIWKSNQPGYYINFTWALGWNDPHHFQYVDGY